MDLRRRRLALAVLAAVAMCAATLTAVVEGFDILEILGKHDEFSQFCKLLNETHLAGDINRDRTITVLAVANGDMGHLTGGHYSLGTLRHILELHVVADYYDDKKLKQLSHAATAASTMFQCIMPRYDDRYDYNDRYDRHGRYGSNTKLYVGQISPHTRTQDHEDLFSKYGRLRNVDLKRDFGFVEFSDPRDADDARHDLDGRRFDGSYIIVEFARGARRGPGGVPLDVRGPPFPGRCYNCGMDGWVRDCKADDWRDRCFRCGELGHIERNCKNSPKDLKRGRSYSRSPSPHHGKGRGRSYSKSLSPHHGRGRGRSYSRSPSHCRGRGRSWSYSRSLSPRNKFKADGEELPPRTSGYSRSPRRSSPPREQA